MLVVVDNASTADQVRLLLPAAATCTTIVTSRSRLSGLVAREGAARMTLDLLTPEESVALIRDIVGSARIDTDPRAAVELVRRCSFLPLALRIIAERIASSPHTPLADFVTALDAPSNQLDALSIHDDELADVRAVFSWSYGALTTDAARCFRLIGLHAGADISIAAVGALAGISIARAARLLEALAAAHLIESTARHRYRLHDLLRAYATERAHAEETPEECRRARRRLYAWYLRMADESRRVILPHSYPLRCGAAASRAVGDQWTEGFALRGAGLVYEERGDIEAAIDRYGRALRVFRDAGVDRGEAMTTLSLGNCHRAQGRLDEAISRYREAVSMMERIEDSWSVGWAAHHLGLACHQADRTAEARAAYERALDVFRLFGDRRSEGASLAALGETMFAVGDVTGARERWWRALDILAAVADPRATEVRTRLAATAGDDQ